MRAAVEFMVVFAAVLVVAGVAVVVPAPAPVPPAPACESVGVRTIPPGFYRVNGHRVDRPAYEVDVLACVGGEVVQRRAPTSALLDGRNAD